MTSFLLRFLLILTATSALTSIAAESASETPLPSSPNAPAPPAAAAVKVDEHTWIAHRLVVAPRYPASLAATGVTGDVDVRLRVSPTGELAEISQITSNPERPEFVAAVRDVLPRWAFRKELDKNCEPRESVGWLRVSFERKDDRPAVSVSKPSDAPWLPRSTAPSTRRSELMKALGDSFPRAGRRSRVGAEVAVAIDVDGNSGRPAKIKATAVDLDWGYVSKQLEFLSASAAEEGAQAATYPILPDYKDKTWRTCLRVSYRIQSE